MNEHAWLSECAYNLTQFNDLVKFSDDYAALPEPVKHSLRKDDDYRMKEILFQLLLARARDSHHRPASDSREYVELLEEIAWKFASDDKIDKCGYFYVAPYDFVELKVKAGRRTGTVSFLAESVLNRSGVADLDSVNLVPRYRFYPSWVREHLICRRTKRLNELARTKY
jgi:hypothetical protein